MFLRRRTADLFGTKPGWPFFLRSQDRRRNLQATPHPARGETTSSAAWRSCDAPAVPLRLHARALAPLAETVQPACSQANPAAQRSDIDRAATSSLQLIHRRTSAEHADRCAHRASLAADRARYGARENPAADRARAASIARSSAPAKLGKLRLRE